MSMTLQELLESASDGELRIARVHGDLNGQPRFIAHPANEDGETLNFVVSGNRLFDDPECGRVIEEEPEEDTGSDNDDPDADAGSDGVVVD